MKRNQTQIRSLTFAAVLAALYTVLTLLSSLFGLSGGAVQLRLSESLTILPAICPAFLVPGAVSGLAVGCFLSNFITGCAVWDVLFGTLATLLGALGTAAMRKFPRLAWISPVLANTLIVPQILIAVYGAKEALWFLTLTVGIGELLSCGGLGLLVTYVWKRVFPKDRI